MKLSEAELRRRLDDVLEATSSHRPGHASVDRGAIDCRAGRIRRRHRQRVVGTSAAFLAVIAVTLVVVGADRDAGRPIRTTDDPPATTAEVPPTAVDRPSTGPITGDVVRTLPDGRTVTLRFNEPNAVFGPFGPGSLWTQPDECPRQLRIIRTEVSSGNGGHETYSGSVTASPAVADTTIVKVLMPWNGGNAAGEGGTVPDLAIVVLRPPAGTTYQLLGEDGSVVDTTSSDGRMLVLLGPSAVPAGAGTDIDATLHGAEGGAPAYRVRAVNSDGTVRSDSPVPQDIGPGLLGTPATCEIPDGPVGLRRDGAPADITTATRAVQALAASLVVSDQGADALLAATDDVADLGPLAVERGFVWMNGASSTAAEIEWTSPTTAWVRLQLSVQLPGQAAPAPIAAPWIRVAHGGNGWRLDRPSACAVLGLPPFGGSVGSVDGRC